MSQIRKRTQNVDYLGTLSTLLRDLQGYSTLAHELIQNADDVKDGDGNAGTTLIEFDIHEDALYVSNDGVFRDQDFRRMENIAGQHKRQEENTTGAFGIGFLSVYQITDSPEIFSSNLHWRFIPTNYPENIEERDVETSGTKFRLPYATDPASEVRIKLHQQAFDKSKLDELEHALANAVVNASPFLKQLSHLVVKRSGKVVQQVRREINNDGVLVLDINGGISRWFLLDGNFEDKANELRQQYPHQIEDKRHHKVTVAIPESVSVHGRLFAVLPTETITSLPFHINADFYPSSDRKEIIFGDDYQSEWNRACIRAVIDIVSEYIDDIRTEFGHIWFWDFLNQMNISGQKAKNGDLDSVFQHLWNEIKEDIANKEIIYTSTRNWVQPHQARILQSQPELDASVIFEQLGINIVSPDLRSHYNLLIEFGAPFLSIEDVAHSLQHHGLNKKQHISAAPTFLGDKSAWQLLWSALDERISKIAKSQRSIAENRLQACAIFLDEHNMLQLAADVYIENGERNTRKAFSWVNWITDDAVTNKIPAILAKPFVLSSAVYELEQAEVIEELWLENIIDLPAIFRWFEDHFDDFERYPKSLLDRFLNLPIFPVSGHLTKFRDDLYIPSDFADPFGASSLIDIKAIGNRKDFLSKLGVKELTFLNFVKYEVRKKFKPEISLTWEELRDLVKLLAERLGILKDNPDIRHLLQDIPLVELDSGDRCAVASQVYIGNGIRNLLGSDILVTNPPSPSISELYKWLGATDKPRTEDIIKRLKNLTNYDTPDEETYEIVEALFKILSGQTLGEHHLVHLKSMAWLPARQQGNRNTTWYKPNQLFNTYQQYLFSESSALFLDFEHVLQTTASEFCKILGIQSSPSIDLVVQHLTTCIERKIPVNLQVYEYLNRAFSQNPESDWVLDLKDSKCILLNNLYVRPDFVYWSQHPFGNFRATLDGKWRPYYHLLTALGVKESPDFIDYCNVMYEIDITFVDKQIDKKVKDVVLRCWEGINYLLGQELISQEDIRLALAEHHLIPNWDDKLIRPNDIVFEDRTDIAKKFDNDILANIIHKDDSLWRAMSAAGVRSLSKASSIHIVECDDPVEDDLLAVQIQERKPLFKRVLDAEVGLDTRDLVDTFFRYFKVCRVRGLAVEYELDIFGGVHSRAEYVSAQWKSDDHTLFFVDDDEGVEIDIARELAFALHPDGNISPWIKDIITAETIQKAVLLLDRQGCPPSHEVYDFENISNIAESQETTTQNEFEKNVNERFDELDEIPEVEDDNEDYSDELEDYSDEKNDGIENNSNIQNGKIDEPSEESVPDKMSGGDAVSGSSLSESTNGSIADKDNTKESTSGSKKHDHAKEHNARKTDQDKSRKPRGKLRSYVTNDSETKNKLDPDRVVERSNVDHAGISFVLEFEKKNGRKPQEMPHENPGYDVLSRDSSGKIRFIEVKSLSGLWSDYSPAALSNTQFEEARKQNEAYWLYVVEEALSATPRLYCIQDPANRITQYLFDNGWISVSEEHQPTK